jgi:hypothetical protein
MKNLKALVTIVLVACASKESVRESSAPPAPPASSSSEAMFQDGEQNVLVELFSSEGCSSCPPADATLRDMDEAQPITNVHVIALEFHVDYWNYLGWKDPFSSAEFSARQRDYGKIMKRAGVYTPQAVVDGQVEMVGSDKARLAEAVANAAKTQHVLVQLKREGETVSITVPGKTNVAYRVVAAQVERGLRTDVPRGENAGKTLQHAPVVRELAEVGTTGEASFNARVQVPAGRAAVVFLVDPDTRAVVGAADIK